jgi:hypothetical protein
MLRNKPKLNYNGLTVILSNPSRHDKNELISGTAAYVFNEECLYPETNRYCCDIRLMDEPSPLLPNTKVILTFGTRAFHHFTGSSLTLDEGRGSPYKYNNIVVVPTFTPQDACDPKDYEKKYNEHLIEEDEEDEAKTEEDKAGDAFGEKSRNKTSRENYRFWLKADVKKALRILNNKGEIPRAYENLPEYYICPDVDAVCDYLKESKDDYLYFDFETDFVSYDIRCFSFSFAKTPHRIFCVPWLNTNYKPYYGQETYKIWQALAIAVRDNILVCHNGSQFDFLMFAIMLRIPVHKVYDTLVAQHRIYPTVEKSLGHCISLYTYEPFHKNEGAHGFYNEFQMRELLQYNGKDIWTMYLVHKGQQDLMSKDRGLKDSINLANRAIVPYLTASINGMKFDDVKRREWLTLNDRKMTQILRVMGMLHGEKCGPLISNQKCVKYFHELLGYPVVGRSKTTNNPSLSEDNLLKLALKIENPIIDWLIKYRQIQKESGTLNFKTWVNNS